jgi:hypothetical protein
VRRPGREVDAVGGVRLDPRLLLRELDVQRALEDVDRLDPLVCEDVALLAGEQVDLADRQVAGRDQVPDEDVLPPDSSLDFRTDRLKRGIYADSPRRNYSDPKGSTLQL